MSQAMVVEKDSLIHEKRQAFAPDAFRLFAEMRAAQEKNQPEQAAHLELQLIDKHYPPSEFYQKRKTEILLNLKEIEEAKRKLDQATQKDLGFSEKFLQEEFEASLNESALAMGLPIKKRVVAKLAGIQPYIEKAFSFLSNRMWPVFLTATILYTLFSIVIGIGKLSLWMNFWIMLVVNIVATALAYMFSHEPDDDHTKRAMTKLATLGTVIFSLWLTTSAVLGIFISPPDAYVASMKKDGQVVRVIDAEEHTAFISIPGWWNKSVQWYDTYNRGVGGDYTHLSFTDAKLNAEYKIKATVTLDKTFIKSHPELLEKKQIEFWDQVNQIVKDEREKFSEQLKAIEAEHVQRYMPYGILKDLDRESHNKVVNKLNAATINSLKDIYKNLEFNIAQRLNNHSNTAVQLKDVLVTIDVDDDVS